jgi:nitroreductase
MEALEAIFTRRSIRRYSEKKVDNDTVNKILRAAMFAPSAVNKQPWHFIVFENAEIKNAIMEIHRSSDMLAEAKKAIAVCYDTTLQHDEGYGVIDCATATQNILLAAHSLGLGACWIGICPRQNRIEALQKIFHLPGNIVPFAVVSLGYPAETKNQPERFKPERIHYERW